MLYNKYSQTWLIWTWVMQNEATWRWCEPHLQMVDPFSNTLYFSSYELLSSLILGPVTDNRLKVMHKSPSCIGTGGLKNTNPERYCKGLQVWHGTHLKHFMDTENCWEQTCCTAKIVIVSMQTKSFWGHSDYKLSHATVTGSPEYAARPQLGLVWLMGNTRRKKLGRYYNSI